MSSLTEREPIKYKGSLDVRFADLDPYGHVNSKHYLDYVSTTRLNYMANEMRVPLDSVTARGIGFYLVKSTINYLRPIVGLQRIQVSSHVAEIKGSKVLVIPFEVQNPDGSITFSEGTLEYAIVDMKTGKLVQAPEWIKELFFKFK